MKTFADSFVPRTVTQGVGDSTFVYGGNSTHLGGSQEPSVRQQMQHFKLWNYVAINSNAEKVSASIPNVARVKTVGVPNKQRQRYLRQFFPGVIRNDLDDTIPVSDSHPLVALLQYINDQDWWESFCYETIMYLGLSGQFYWRVINNALGLPSALQVIPPHWIKAKRNLETGELLHWTVTPNGSEQHKFTLTVDEVIYYQSKNPNSKLDALSPTAAGFEWIVSSELVEKARNATYLKGNMQSLLLQLDKDVYGDPSAVTRELLERTESKFMSRYNGVMNMHRPITTPPGLNVVPLGLKPSDMLLPEMSDQIRDFVLALHRVPKVVAGVAHDVNMASINGANLIWCENKIMPLLRLLSGFMTEHLAKRFDPGLVIWFDDVRPSDGKEEREEVKLDFEMGAITPDERRLARGYKALGTPASQKTYMAMNRVALDVAGDDTEPEEDPEKPDDSEQEQRYNKRHSFAVRQSKRRASIQRAYLRLQSRHEKRMASRLTRFFNKQAKLVEAALEAAGDGIPPVTDFLRSDKFREGFNAALRLQWAASWADGADFERRVLGLPQQQSIKMNVDDLPEIAVDYSPAMRRSMGDFLRQRMEGVWRFVYGTTRKTMEDAIAKSIQAGEHITDIRKKLVQVLRTSKEHATTIARTESTASLNFGQQALRDDEEVPNKQWIATVDGKTRATHSAADMQVVPNSTPFVVGGNAMQHPGDGSLGAGAAEIVNCRCCASGTYEDVAE